MSAPANADAAELARFDAQAHQFWDDAGPFHALHALQPARFGFVAARARLAGAQALDVGCGGGLLAESLTRAGATVTAIDLAPAMIEVAKLHALESGQPIDYRLAGSAQWAAARPGAYDVVCCMELAEHVPDPAALLGDLATLLRPGGQLFVSTINRTVSSFLGAIVAAEYLLRLVPRGTHEYARLIRPSELARAARAAGLELREVCGLQYDPLRRRATLGGSAGINYLAHFSRPAVGA
jgi:2-polyprenyl-6-hydroxyphenyl methylase/3-demethylubiquinone-9 3-methyltransferase